MDHHLLPHRYMKRTKKLDLSRTTIKALDRSRLDAIAGGASVKPCYATMLRHCDNSGNSCVTCNAQC